MKSDYALRALVEMAATYGGRPIQSAEIAARRSIPESYLEQLLTVLRKAGLVNSIRGPQGGHTLAVHPSRITALDVVRALEGPVVVLDCAGSADPCCDDPACGLLGLWGEVRSAIERVLDGVSIEDLAARQAASRGGVMYHI